MPSPAKKIGLHGEPPIAMSSRDEVFRPELCCHPRQYDDGQTRTLARVGLATMVMR
jgi:hypothetical protein